MTKTDLLVGLSEIRVTPTARNSPRASLKATAYKLADVLTQIALDPDATRCFVAAMAPPCCRVQEFLVTCFTIIQEELVAAGDLDQVTRF